MQALLAVFVSLIVDRVDPSVNEDVLALGAVMYVLAAQINMPR